MQDYPYRYTASTESTPDNEVSIMSEGLPTLSSAAPTEFGGPGDQWSPETLIVAAVADCFVLTFKAIAHYSKFSWRSISCEVLGVLDRVERSLQFTEFKIVARLVVPEGSDMARASRILEKAERQCLITNSLNSRITLDIDLQIQKSESD